MTVRLGYVSGDMSAKVMTKKKNNNNNNNNNNEQACSCKQHMVNSFLIISQFLVTGFELHVTLVSRDTASQEISLLLQPMRACGQSKNDQSSIAASSQHFA